ncbi:MAG TPA: chromosomal replication initiator protein DnaA [Xanthobacteraceae bacterium]|nr:chromosomal replication initiator protein DnaA [Xanthobacteraceae bacterium]
MAPQKQEIPDNNDAGRWDRVRRRLRAEVGEDVYSSWFARMELEDCGTESVRLSVPTRFLRNWIQSHYAERLVTLWRGEQPAMKKIDLVVRSSVSRAGFANIAMNTPAKPNVIARANGGTRLPLPSSGPLSMRTDKTGSSPLDPRLTFSSFLVGRSNALAHAAARQVVEAEPGTVARFNPLYIYASVGLGKTHLLQAIAWAGETNGRRVSYLTAEKFMYGFVAALKNQSAIAFKEALRGIDVLIIDDLQFLQGKTVQQEFCHTLNALIDAGRQVVVAADRAPPELETLEERVRSRLAGGLVVEIGALEEALRLSILEARIAAIKAEHPAFDVPQSVVNHVAHQVTQNGRDLDGAMTRLLAHNQLSNRTITIELADEVIRDLVRPSDPRRIRVEDILRIVAKHYGVSRSDLLSSRRTANVVRPRQIAMYLAKTLTLRSLPEIGRRFGGRDHTTVLHAVRKIDAHVATDKVLAEEVEVLKRLLLEA